MSDFFEFKHECDKMPDDIRFLKINGSTSSQFTIEASKSGAGHLMTTLYGFRFCPYCGDDMEAVKR